MLSACWHSGYTLFTMPITTQHYSNSPGSIATLSLILILAGCGGSGSDPTPAPSPPVIPPPNSTSSLPGDDQLKTASDPQAALADVEATRWFAQHSQILRSLEEDSDFSDLDFMREQLADKRLVLLGESSQGVKEYSQAKVRLIKYLHEIEGYNLLAFESGLYECDNVQRSLQQLSAQEAMQNCLFGVWHTQTVRELFAYIQTTQQTSNPLRVTGFDVQASSLRFQGRAQRTSSLVDELSPTYGAEVGQLERDYYALTQDSLAAQNGSDPSISALRAALPDYDTRYTELADYLIANITGLTSSGNYTEEDVRIVAQYARTSPRYAEQLSQRFENGGGGQARDLGMAQNLIALANDIYSDEKIVVWAHNAHLRHQGTGFLPDANMGKYVHDALEDTLYTVGFYMYRGEHAFNDRSIRAINAPLNNSLEAIFYSRRFAYLFLDIENAPTSESGGSWLTTSTPTWAWGSSFVPLVLADEYDGLFIIDTVSPPQYR